MQTEDSYSLSSCSYKKEPVKKSIIFMSVMAGMLFIFFIVSVSLPTVRTMDNCTLTSKQSAYVNEKRLSSTTYFQLFDDETTVYQFSHETCKKLEGKEENTTFSSSEKVDAYDFVFYPIWPEIDLSTGNLREGRYMTISYYYTLSDLASVYLMDTSQFYQYKLGRDELPRSLIEDKNVTEVNRTYRVTFLYNEPRPVYIVVVNLNPFPIKVTEYGWFNHTSYKLESNTPMKTCKGKGKCSFSLSGTYSSGSCFIVKYEGKQSIGFFSLTDGVAVWTEGLVGILTPLCAAIALLIILAYLWMRLVPSLQNNAFFSCTSNCSKAPCTKDKFKYLLIIFGIVLGVLFLLFIILLCAIPPYKGTSCNGIDSVGSGYETICVPSQDYHYLDKPDDYDENAIRFETDDSHISAYQYDSLEFLKLKKYDNTTTFYNDVTVKGKSYAVLYNATLTQNSAEPAVIYLNHIMNPSSIMALVDVSKFKSSISSLMSSGYCDLSSCVILGRYVEKVNQSFSFSNKIAYSLVVVNSDYSDVKVSGQGKFKSWFHKMDPARAIKVCYKDCTFSNVVGTKIVLRYSSNETYVPVSLLELSDNFDFTTIFFVFPSLMIPLLFVIAILYFFYPRSSDLEKTSLVKHEEY